MIEAIDHRECYLDLGFKEPPFSITPDTSYFFPGSKHVSALNHLEYGLASGGFTLLTGEIGLGKTLLCRTLLKNKPSGIRTAYIFNPPPTFTELLHSIHYDLTGKKLNSNSYGTCLKEMYSTLLELAENGEKVAVVLDEAHRLGKNLLEGLRLVSNLETEKEKLVNLILVGQPELLKTLRLREMRPLNQRIGVRFTLEPFGLQETINYIKFRLAKVRKFGAFYFTWPAMIMAHFLTKGTPRRINQICDRALLGAYALDKEVVGISILLRAASEIRGIQ